MEKDIEDLLRRCNEVEKECRNNKFWTLLILSASITYIAGTLLIILFK